jgi:hypothetical protein
MRRSLESAASDPATGPRIYSSRSLLVTAIHDTTSAYGTKRTKLSSRSRSENLAMSGHSGHPPPTVSLQSRCANYLIGKKPNREGGRLRKLRQTDCGRAQIGLSGVGCGEFPEAKRRFAPIPKSKIVMQKQQTSWRPSGIRTRGSIREILPLKTRQNFALRSPNWASEKFPAQGAACDWFTRSQQCGCLPCPLWSAEQTLKWISRVVG